MAFDVGAFKWNHLKDEGDNVPRWSDWEKEHATNSGALPYQMYQLQERAKKEGIKIEGDKNQFGNMDSPWDYAGYGGYGFELADAQAMSGDLGKIRGARDWARQHGLTIGGGVTEHIQGLESDRRFEAQQTYNASLLQQQQQQAAYATKIQQEMAAQAARVKGSSPTGVGSAASIKGSRLAITESKGRKGTKQFSRPTEYLNTLGIGGGGATSRSSTVTL